LVYYLRTLFFLLFYAQKVFISLANIQYNKFVEVITFGYSGLLLIKKVFFLLPLNIRKFDSLLESFSCTCLRRISQPKSIIPLLRNNLQMYLDIPIQYLILNEKNLIYIQVNAGY
jgi:hypothetical protein